MLRYNDHDAISLFYMNLKWPGVIIEHSSCTVSKKHQLWTNTDVGRLRVPRRSRKLESDCNPNVFFFLLPLLLFHNESISPSYNRWNIPQRKKERKKERKKDRERENKRNQAPHTIAPTVFLFLILFFFLQQLVLDVLGCSFGASIGGEKSVTKRTQ